MFWLSHHFPEAYHRCYRLGRLHVCARCLGLYPVLAVTFVAQLVVGAPLELSCELAVGLLLAAPATIDWAVGQFHPRWGSNPWRTATGALLGLALGRSLFIHVQRPFPPVLLAQLTLVTAVAVPVILVAYRKRRRG